MEIALQMFANGVLTIEQRALAEALTLQICLKINPLIDWDASQIEGYFIQHDLPRHPLIAQGYPSIGCSPCTTQVAPGEDPRSGRWKGWDKTECGIHKPGEDPFL
jgi:phosphoadenosine phosphosulfate reductase